MPENGKAGAYAPAFLSERSPLEKMPLVRRWEDEAEAGKKGILSARLLTTGESLPAFCLAGRAARYIPRSLRQRPAGKRTGYVPVCREGGFYSTGSSGRKDAIR